MRTLLLISVLLVAGFFLVRQQSKSPSKPSPIEPAAAAQPLTVAPMANAKSSMAPQPAEDLTETFYTGYGMPVLGSAWDAAALTQVTATLRKIGQNRPPALPGPGTDYGKAFFTKLLQTTQRFHLLSPENKVATYNAFTGLFPAFSVTRSDGRPRDRELALLTGLEFELIAGFTEDPSFVKDPHAQKSRSMQDLSGNTIVARASNIHFIGHASTVARDVERRLKMIGDPVIFGPEARALALSRISKHLPTIVSRLDLTNIRPILETNRTSEPDLKVREYYTALLMRIP